MTGGVAARSTASIRVRAASAADDLGYRGQKAVADAVGDMGDYRLVGGHMVRLLHEVFPCERATPRVTVDADAALGGVEVLGPVVRELLDAGFSKVRGNAFEREAPGGRSIEVDILLPREDHRPGARPVRVPGVGQVDTLPELSLALASAPLAVEVEAHLTDGQILRYAVKVPDLEMAALLKAFSWDGRSAAKDVLDLVTLLEIREAHSDEPWSLHRAPLTGRRRDAARIMSRLAAAIARDHYLPGRLHGVDRRRAAALIRRHVGRP